MKNLILLFTIAFCVTCTNQPEPKTEETIIPFDIESAKKKYNEFANYSKAEQDTLMTNLTTFIFRKPSSSTWETKFNPEFRSYFIENAYNLEITYLHHQSDSLYYYYLLRDARDNKGMAKRGVAGKFYLNEKMAVTGFEEFCNTPIYEENKLVEIGFTLMEEMVAVGNVNKFLKDKTVIEWPDGNLFYSTKKHEWRAVE